MFKKEKRKKDTSERQWCTRPGGGADMQEQTKRRKVECAKRALEPAD